MKRINLGNWKKYSFEFLSIFVAVISAFALNNWNDGRKSSIAEESILTEIYNGFGKDLADLDENYKGHLMGIRVADLFLNLINNKTTTIDSFEYLYTTLTRDFISIQNTSGYEALKSKGLELISNDSLRTKIISIYEFDYKILSKMEEEYEESQFFRNYFKGINDILSKHFVFNEENQMVGIEAPLKITEAEKKLLLTYILRIKRNRIFVTYYYSEVKKRIEQVRNDIKVELDI